MIWTEPPDIYTPIPIPGLHPLVSKALLRKGLRTPEAVQAFFDPRAYSPAHPTQLPGLVDAIDRLVEAIRKRDPICVWGDFDADGQTSTTILYQTLKDLDAIVTFHIPVRASEGHGVNIPHLEKILERGVKLILTCDTGISAHAEVEFARTLCVDFLITDHHDLPETLPKAAAIVNPKFLPEDHPLATLSGSGVAYKLAEELYGRFGRAGEATRHLDLAAIGLVADLAGLTGDSRYLVQLGLEALRKTRRLGLQTMLEITELVPANLTEQHIGFILGPRLNALGRLGDANSAVDLLSTSDPVRARVLATQLEGLNAQRQFLCSQVTRAAEAQLSADPTQLEGSVIVLSNPTWPGGVVGIVASRLVDRYRKPAILFSTPPGEPAHGSARSIEGLNITAAIAAQKDLLRNFGGHPMAAGLSLDQEKLPEFTRRLGKTVTEMLENDEKDGRLKIDGWLSLPEITDDLGSDLEKLAPYGPGNEKLTLATHSLILQSATPIGRNQEHLKLKVDDGNGNSRVVLWWNGADEKEYLPEGRFDLAYSLRASDWRGSLQLQMEFVDFRVLEAEKIETGKRKLEIVDYRNVQEPLQILTTIQDQSSMIIWSEGQGKEEAGGKGLHDLEPADALAIWTIPASPEELRNALVKVRPRVVYLFAVSEPIRNTRSSCKTPVRPYKIRG